MKRSELQIIVAVLLVILASFLRVANASWHIYNFAPIAAIGLFSGSVIYSKKGLAFLLPLGSMLLADVYFQFFTSTPGFYPGQLFNYGALAAATLLGFAMKQPKPLITIPFIFGASTLFFMVSNFGYFLQGYNGVSFQGLVKTYVDAIPFFQNTLQGDMIGGIVLFGIYFLAQRQLNAQASKVTA